MCATNSANKKLKYFQLLMLYFGGRGEIRTHEGAEPPAGFQDRCLKPLGHPSGPVNMAKNP
jgi:hypothetical protein